VNPDLDMEQDIEVYFKELRLDPSTVPLLLYLKPTVTIGELKVMI